MSDLMTASEFPPHAVLRVRVGEPVARGLERAQAVMLALQAGKRPHPYFGVGFSEVGQMLAVFTPKRWELIAALRQAGPTSVRALARRLQRDYKNVHTDVGALEHWMAVQRLPDGRVHVPWAEIVMDMHLPQALAA